MATASRRRYNNPATVSSQPFDTVSLASLQGQDISTVSSTDNVQRLLLPSDQLLLEQTSQSQTYHPIPMDPHVLSVENYEAFFDGPENTTEADQPRNLSSGSPQTQEHQSSPPQARTKTRRGSKKDNSKASNPDDTTRQRGRPRLNTKDQTPAERRRTQIRLAQRAYRQRKETTISGLSARVSSLEQTIQDMHNIFGDVHDEAVAAGVYDWNSAFAEKFDKAAATFVELAKNGIHEADAEEEDLDAGHTQEVPAEAGRDILSSRDMRPRLAQRESDPGQRRRQPGADAGLGSNTVWGYTPTFEPLTLIPDQPIESQETAQEVEDAPMQDWVDPGSAISRPNQDFQLYRAEEIEPLVLPPGPSVAENLSFLWNVPSSAFNELPLPKTLSHSETSFARRLVRRSLESAIKLLSSPESSAAAINEFCRFTFCYINQPRALAGMKQMICQKATESLEFWQMPSWHEGGAGLHFPRVGIDASSDPPENWADPGPVGPAFEYSPEHDHWNGVLKAQMLQELGVDGEWFDSNDVEQYLHTKGVHLTGQSSIVEITEEDAVDVPELGASATVTTGPTTAASPSMTHSSGGGPQSPSNDFVPTNAVIYGHEGLFNTEDSLGYDDAIPDIDVDKVFAHPSPNTLSQNKTAAALAQPEFDFHHFPLMDQMDLLQSFTQPQSTQNPDSYFDLKPKRYVDVEKLIDCQFPPSSLFLPTPLSTSFSTDNNGYTAIVPQGVCLGRTPGFRRANIDDALKSATSESVIMV